MAEERSRPTKYFLNDTESLGDLKSRERAEVTVRCDPDSPHHWRPSSESDLELPTSPSSSAANALRALDRWGKAERVRLTARFELPEDTSAQVAQLRASLMDIYRALVALRPLARRAEKKLIALSELATEYGISAEQLAALLGGRMQRLRLRALYEGTEQLERFDLDQIAERRAAAGDWAEESGR